MQIAEAENNSQLKSKRQYEGKRKKEREEERGRQSAA